MFLIKKFERFNNRRYSTPWVGVYDLKKLKISFDDPVGTYMGDNNGGDLILHKYEEDKLYAYGQKDYRGNSSFVKYFYIHNGRIIEFDKKDLFDAICELKK